MVKRMRILISSMTAPVVLLALVACGGTAPSAVPASNISPPTSDTMSTPHTGALYATFDKKTLENKSSIIAMVAAESTEEVQTTSRPLSDYPTDDPRYPYAPGFTPTAVSLPARQVTARVIKVMKGKGSVSPGATIKIWYLPSDATPPKERASAVKTNKRYIVHLSDEQRPAPDVWWSTLGPHSMFMEKDRTAKSGGQDIFVPVAPNEAVPEIILPAEG